MKAGCSVIIFVNTKKFAELLGSKLTEAQIKAAVLIGGKDTKQQRQAIIEKFRRGEYKVLITTNLLARGFDERTIGLVINFDLPRETTYGGGGDRKEIKPDCETFLHRVGRTGRFGDVGIAVNLYSPEEENLIKEIEKFYDIPITPLEGDETKTFDKIEDCLEEVIKINNEKRKELGEKKKVLISKN